MLKKVFAALFALIISSLSPTWAADDKSKQGTFRFIHPSLWILGARSNGAIRQSDQKWL